MITLVFKTLVLKILILGLVFEFLPCSKTYAQLTQEQAIQHAESYIIDNGYTNLPADRSKFSNEHRDEYDSIKYENWIEEMLKERQNTLQRKAFCISENEDRWNVGFLFTEVDLDKLDSIPRQADLHGMAVVVYKNGKEIRFGENIPAFSKFNKL